MSGSPHGAPQSEDQPYRSGTYDALSSFDSAGEGAEAKCESVGCTRLTAVGYTHCCRGCWNGGSHGSSCINASWSGTESLSDSGGVVPKRSELVVDFVEQLSGLSQQALLDFLLEELVANASEADIRVWARRLKDRTAPGRR